MTEDAAKYLVFHPVALCEKHRFVTGKDGTLVTGNTTVTVLTLLSTPIYIPQAYGIVYLFP